MKLVTETKLPGSDVVEVVARALYAHNNNPGADPMTVPWPPKLRQQLMKYWNAAHAVVKAQRAFVARREQDRSEGCEPSPLAAGSGQPGTHLAAAVLALNLPQAAGAGYDVNLPFARVPHCACDEGIGPAWTNSEYVARTAACKLRGGPCASLNIHNPAEK